MPELPDAFAARLWNEAAQLGIIPQQTPLEMAQGPAPGNFLEQVAQNPGGSLPTGQQPSPVQANAPMSPAAAAWKVLKNRVPYELQSGANTLKAIAEPPKRLFGEGEFWKGPRDPQAAADMRAILLGTGAGSMGVPRPAGSLGAYGRHDLIEKLPRKATEYGGVRKLAEARRSELAGTPPEDIWEQYGWARNPMSRDDARFNPAVGPDEWYSEYGSSPKAMGDRYPLTIGERRRTAPWKTSTDAPEAAFEAPPSLLDPSSLAADKPILGGSKQRAALSAEAGASSPARKLSDKLRSTEDAMRKQGLNDAQIANRIGAEYGMEVFPADLRTGRVWWRVSDREAMGRSAPRSPWADEAVSRLKDKDVMSLTNKDAAEIMQQHFGHPYTTKSVQEKRRSLGLLDTTPSGYQNKLERSIGPGAEEAIKKYYVDHNLSRGDVAKRVSDEFKTAVSPKTVENWLRRHGIKKNSK